MIIDNNPKVPAHLRGVGPVLIIINIHTNDENKPLQVLAVLGQNKRPPEARAHVLGVGSKAIRD